jgi:hypothetical protein
MRTVHYTNFAEFKGGLLEAGFPGADGKSDPKIDILFEYYRHARGQTNLTLGRLADTQPLREKLGSAFDGGAAQLLLTPKASGFSTQTPASGKKSVQDQMESLLGKRWSIWLNDSFILGGIHSHVPFTLVSDISDYEDPNADFTFNVTQRELIGLITFGYERGDPTAGGAQYKCTNTVLADGATFRAYVDQMKLWVAATKS